MRWRKAGQTGTANPGNLGTYSLAPGIQGVGPIRVSGNAPAAGSRGVARTIPCAHCTTPVTRLPSQIRGSVFCSRSCMGQYQRKPITRDCVVCGARFHYEMTSQTHAEVVTCWRHRDLIRAQNYTMATVRKPPASYQVTMGKLACDIRRRASRKPLDYDLSAFA